jgi:hypothetical protein
MYLGDTVGKTIAGNLWGRREKPSKVALFMNRNQGFMNPSEVFPKRTEDADYDLRVAAYWGDMLRDIVEPSIESLDERPQEMRAELFTNLMQRARSRAEFLAEVEYLREGKALPESLTKRTERSIERGLYQRIPFGLPPTKRPKNFQFLLLPPNPEEQQIP